MKSEIHNFDCLEYMRTLPDKAFNLCIADPPYGIDINSSGHLVKAKGWEYKTWDKDAPSKEWFKELRRVSKHCIIWWANHFISKLPYDSPCWFVWDKENGENDFADCVLDAEYFTKGCERFNRECKGIHILKNEKYVRCPLGDASSQIP